MRTAWLMLTCLLTLLFVAGPGRIPQSAHAQTGSVYWEQKFCSACGREVPLSSHTGQRCPHCGAYWSYETTDVRQTDVVMPPPPPPEMPPTVTIACGDLEWDSDYRKVAGSLLVPVRTFEKIGAVVTWDKRRGVTLGLDRVTVSLQTGKSTLTISTSVASAYETASGTAAAEAATIPQPAVQLRDCRPSPRLVGGTTIYVPLRAVAEALGFVVEWDGVRVILSR